MVIAESLNLSVEIHLLILNPHPHALDMLMLKRSQMNSAGGVQASVELGSVLS